MTKIIEFLKRIDRKYIALLVMAVLLATCLFKTIEVSGDMTDTLNKMTKLEEKNKELQKTIDSVYTNVDAILKEEASIVLGTKYEIGKMNDTHDKVDLTFSLVPKHITEGMKVEVTIEGETLEMTKNGVEYSATTQIDAFIKKGIYPLLTITTADGILTEYLDTVKIEAAYAEYFPTLSADISGASSPQANTLKINSVLTVKAKSKDDFNIDFVSYTVIEMINGVEHSRKDITSEITLSNDGKEYVAPYVGKYDVTDADNLQIYVEAVDEFGYTHRRLAYQNKFDDSNKMIKITSGEFIYDTEGNEIYEKKD